MKVDNSKLKNEVFKVDGSDLYFIDDIVFVCPNNYSHFYKIEEAFDYYKKLHQILNKKVIFIFKDYELTIDDKTTLEEVMKQIDLQDSLNFKDLNENKEYNIILKNSLIKKIEYKK